MPGISHITFMMNPASLPHAKLMRATKLIGTGVAPALSGRELYGDGGSLVVLVVIGLEGILG
jgi:hypothetical protein